jgi:Amt family ammonium transporter
MDAATVKVALDTIWVMFAGCLVFFMNAGFALLESGLCQAKNAVNILAKNFIVFAVASIAFWAFGFGLMFGDGTPYFGTQGWFLGGADNSPETNLGEGAKYAGVFGSIAWATVPLFVKFFFQLVFAGTAATIVSGVVAERIKFVSFIVFSFLLVAVVYPTVGHWIWGGGWLAVGDVFVRDFAGSTVVHSVGGWAALAGVLILGPRLGKFTKDGRVQPIPGHSMALATLGTLILWLGWFGFNPGSTMAADPAGIGLVAVNTNMAAAAGCLAATVVAWLFLGKPDLSMILNGTLAGLVAITAPCYWVGPGASLVIGLVAGVLVVFAVLAFDKVKVDDPVGALSVHLVNGVFGTVAVGIFADRNGVTGLLAGGGSAQLLMQLKGIAAVGAFTFVASSIVWLAIKLTMGIRVSAEEEYEGLDKGEHGMEAYPGQMPVSMGGLAPAPRKSTSPSLVSAPSEA